MPDNPAHAPNHALIPCAYLCTNAHDSFSNPCQRVNLSLCHKPPWLILLSQIHSMAQRCVTWPIMCLLHVCPAFYCKLSAGLSCQAVSSGVAGYSYLPDRPSPTPLLLRPLEVHLVRAASWQQAYFWNGQRFEAKDDMGKHQLLLLWQPQLTFCAQIFTLQGWDSLPLSWNSKLISSNLQPEHHHDVYPCISCPE